MSMKARSIGTWDCCYYKLSEQPLPPMLTRLADLFLLRFEPDPHLNGGPGPV
ncbi:hypothetical protein GQ55_1G426000 [Panicum hallii var. hallii]|uniref:Uncharacterized protein n=1 Tax=Panicum hallii var. hallii TaxID=1504633 RepID=A0A2T7FDE2_9POAL|nr:hypothetical protein GQ55_1G426000 [Panicum hallii var. hallii]